MKRSEDTPFLWHRTVSVLSDKHYNSSRLLLGSAGAAFFSRMSAEGGQEILTFVRDERGYQCILLQPASD